MSISFDKFASNYFNKFVSNYDTAEKTYATALLFQQQNGPKRCLGTLINGEGFTPDFISTITASKDRANLPKKFKNEGHRKRFRDFNENQLKFAKQCLDAVKPSSQESKSSDTASSLGTLPYESSSYEDSLSGEMAAVSECSQIEDQHRNSIDDFFSNLNNPSKRETCFQSILENLCEYSDKHMIMLYQGLVDHFAFEHLYVLRSELKQHLSKLLQTMTYKDIEESDKLNSNFRVIIEQIDDKFNNAIIQFISDLYVNSPEIEVSFNFILNHLNKWTDDDLYMLCAALIYHRDITGLGKLQKRLIVELRALHNDKGMTNDQIAQSGEIKSDYGAIIARIGKCLPPVYNRDL